MKRNEWILVIGVVIVVAVIASSITSNMTGNTIMVAKGGQGPVYSVAEVDAKLKNLGSLNISGRIYAGSLGFTDLIYGPNSNVLITSKSVRAGRAELNDYQLAIQDTNASFFANALNGYGSFIVLNYNGKSSRFSVYGVTMESPNKIKWCCGPNNNGIWSCVAGIC